MYIDVAQDHVRQHGRNSFPAKNNMSKNSNMRKKTQLKQINLSSKDYKKAKSDWNSEAAKMELVDRMAKGEIKYTSSKGKIFTVNLGGDTYKLNMKKDISKKLQKDLFQSIYNNTQQNMSTYKKRKQSEEKTWYVTGNYVMTKTYNYTNNKAHLKPQKYSYETPYNKTIKARNKEEAEKIALDEVEDDIENHFEDSMNVVSTKVGKVTASATAGPSSSSGPSSMAMRAATYVDYDFIPADTTHLKNEGFCVIDRLLGKYKDLEERMAQWIKDNWNT